VGRAVKHDDIVKLPERYFGWIQKRNDPPRVTIREPMPTESKSVTIEMRNAPAPVCGYISVRFRPLTKMNRTGFRLKFSAATKAPLYRDLVAINKSLFTRGIPTTTCSRMVSLRQGALQAPVVEAKTISGSRQKAH